MAHGDAAGVNGSNRILFHGAPPSRMMPNGCLGSPVLVLLLVLTEASSWMSGRSAQRTSSYPRMSMWPTQFGRMAIRAEVWPTDARKDLGCQTLVGGFAWLVSQGVASRPLMPHVVDLPEPWEAQDVPRVQAAHRPEGAGCVRRQPVAWARLAQCESMVKGAPPVCPSGITDLCFRCPLG